YFLMMIVLGFCSCQKEISQTDASRAEVDVYVAGYEDYVAKYWKNGSPVTLTDCSDATSIVVVGSDVYVTGGDGSGAKYWKNGSPVTLGDGSKRGGTSFIAVSGNDVHVAGVEYFPDGNAHAVYWKNGQPTYLPENTRPVQPTDNYPVSSIASTANSIFVSGSDIYIAGGERITKEISTYPNPNHIYSISALYWKNGNAVYLILGSYYNSKADEAYSIFVDGQDVYACGALSGQYWKNGNPVSLGGAANSIFVSEGDVYVAGSQPDGEPYQTYNGTRNRTVAKYWKNGTPVSLTDGIKNAYATSIAVSENDVYVAGYEEKTAGTQNWVAKYWKNGNPVILGDVSKESGANSIFLAKR
ncbi:MAG TPA: hypothetical protein VFH08_12340, partial [Chitinophagaceae bacterium]|nr:hypothetical protein [Chitinophagaceae bacterium]